MRAGQIFNIYCDESGHLERDQSNVMVLGAVWCPLEKTREIAVRLREIKQKHNLSDNFELKWVKVSPAKLRYYIDVVDYFLSYSTNRHGFGHIFRDLAMIYLE